MGHGQEKGRDLGICKDCFFSDSTADTDHFR